MKELPPTAHEKSISPAEILQGLEAHIDAVGLRQAQADFRAMEGILSGISQWSEVKRLCVELFAEKREAERQREQEAELERLRAGAPNIFQVLPTAQMGVSVDGGALRPDSLTQLISGSQVFNSPISGCVFAMPGATVSQQPMQEVKAARESVAPLGHVFLNPAKGMKIDFIRVMNALFELGFFQTAQGGRITKKEFFTTIGQAVNVDLSNYDKALSRSTADSTVLEKHLCVFDEMRRKMTEIFNSK